MNKTFIYLIFLAFFSVSSCNEKIEGVDAIKIINDSDDDIVVFISSESFFNHMLIGGPKEGYTNREYKDLLRDICIPSHSVKYFDHWRKYMNENYKTDTLYWAIFNMLDYDTLSRDEFKSKYPIKYEYKVTLQNMIDTDWILIYPPNG